MKLKGEYFQQVRDALLDAYKFESLRSMIRIELDEDLEEIVSRGTFQEQVEELILWAERKQRIGELISGARQMNPDNEKLETVEASVISKEAYLADAPRESEPIDREAGDTFTIGDINDARGIAIGRGASVTIHNQANKDTRDEQYEIALEWESKGRPRMRGFDLSGRNLAELSLMSADLQEANLRDAKLYGANLSGAFLIKADLSGADLRKATLISTSLMGSKLLGARLNRSNMEWARLNKANLSGADLSNADLHETEFREATYTRETIWPENFDAQAAGAILVDEDGNPVVNGHG